jgi:hypothetical protein
VGIRLTRVYDSAILPVKKAFISCIKVTAPARNVLAADVFGTDIFH